MQTDMLVLECRQCGCVRVDGRWRYDADARPVLGASARIYCPDCCRQAMAELFRRSLEPDGALRVRPTIAADGGRLAAAP